ncbi:hypothetical protein HPB47_021139 [Ixodes persulcatus]|uniref:Uncharacterized protein n=1 Tax=Ixodes persulcatus TaxID=34615 RepID=A0AC60QDD4_IXOPE|nr:hypothetical protein HPB47_021139 [Ixodes persulcatus]
MSLGITHGSTFGSDHYIIELKISLPGFKCPKPRVQECTDWDLFRQKRSERGVESIEAWCADVVDDTAQATKEVENPTQANAIDSRLHRMLEAYRSLYDRWKSTGKRFPKLRKRAARLYKDIESYAGQLNHQRWQQLCNEIQGQLHTKNPWHLFRRILAPDDTKGEKRKLLTKIVREHEGDMASIFEELKTKYLDSPSSSNTGDMVYSGEPNERLDAPITEHELRRALEDLKTSSAPGADKVTNKMLRIWTTNR